MCALKQGIVVCSANVESTLQFILNYVTSQKRMTSETMEKSSALLQSSFACFGRVERIKNILNSEEREKKVAMKVIVGANIAKNQFYRYTINMAAKPSTLYNSINFV